MRPRLPLLIVTSSLLVWPAGAQTTFENDEQPFFIGRVNNSPIPSRKSAPPPETTEETSETGDGTGDATATGDGAETGRVTITTRPVAALTDPAADESTGERIGAGSETTAAAPANSDAIETRPLPVVLRPRETPEPEAEPDANGDGDGHGDAGGRIKSVPDPDADPEDTRDDRFVRAPEGKTFESDETEKLGAPIPAPETDLQPGAKLRQLDKMTGRIVTFDIAVGQTLQVARLLVKLDACRAPDDNDTHGTMAHVKIWDTKTPDEDASFAGWMFAESPALSALDHPRYDLWVINCTTVSAEASAASE